MRVQNWLPLSCTLVVCACDPEPYNGGSSGSGDETDEVTATVDWLDATFTGIYQLDSYHVSEDSCSAAGLNRRGEVGDFFWVHADSSGGVFSELCVCGATIEQCQDFAAAVDSGEQVLCPLQRIVTDRSNSTTAMQRIDIAGTWDGANNCLAGGTDTVTFERIGNQLEIDHQQTLVNYVVTDGQCTPERGRVAAQGRPCTARDVVSGTVIAEE